MTNNEKDLSDKSVSQSTFPVLHNFNEMYTPPDAVDIISKFMIDTFGRERVDDILSDKSLFKIKDWEYIDMMKKWWSDVELLIKSKSL